MSNRRNKKLSNKKALKALNGTRIVVSPQKAIVSPHTKKALGSSVHVIIKDTHKCSPILVVETKTERQRSLREYEKERIRIMKSIFE